MRIFLSSVNHDLRSNTLEATWLQETQTSLVPVRCHNYSADQKAEFLADLATFGEPVDGQKYVVMAGW